LGQPEKYASTLESLDVRTQRIRQRQEEAHAHQQNKAMGRKRGTKKED
jgi:hypothetical protein